MPAEKEGGRKYGLPTEAQWEYACRAGTDGRRFFSPLRAVPETLEEKFLPKYGWFGTLAGSEHPVGQNLPNAWGLFDMYGNMWEWCQDFYDPKYYENSPTDDPSGPAVGSEHVHRGGGWSGTAWCCRSAIRVGAAPQHRRYNSGCRVVCSVPEKPAGK